MVAPYRGVGITDPYNGNIYGPGERPVYSGAPGIQPTVQPNATTPPAPAAPSPGGAPATTGGTGMSPYSGFASQYAPGMLGSIYDAPYTILPDVFNGLDLASPLYQTLAGMQADPLTLYTLLMGADSSFGEGDEGDEAFVNWLAQMYQQLGTAGGQGFNINTLLGNLFGTDTSEDSDTALNAVLRAGDTNQQARFLYNLIRDATNVGMNPLAAMGYQSATARSMDQWRNDVLRGESGSNMTPLEWIRANNPGLVVSR